MAEVISLLAWRLAKDMKIEVDLLKIDQATDKARCCAVALLCALPYTEAALAVAQWKAALSSDAQAIMVESTHLRRPPQDAGCSAAEAAAKVAAAAGTPHKERRPDIPSKGG